MRVLVTGSEGQVGSELGPHLGGHDVVAAGHRDLDLTSEESVRAGVAGARPDVVVNCAAYNDVDGAETDEEAATAVNGEGVARLARACAEQGAHLVHVSTDYVFSGRQDGPYLEDDEPDPRSAYGRSKLAGERAVAELAPSWAVVRTAWVFGRRGRSFVEAILRRARAGEALRVVDDQRGSPTYAADLAGVLAALATRRAAGVFHATNAGTCTWFELAGDVVAAAGLEGVEITPIGTAELGRPAPRPANSVLASRRLEAAGVPPLRHYREALAEVVPLLAAAASGSTG